MRMWSVWHAISAGLNIDIYDILTHITTFIALYCTLLQDRLTITWTLEPPRFISHLHSLLHLYSLRAFADRPMWFGPFFFFSSNPREIPNIYNWVEVFYSMISQTILTPLVWSTPGVRHWFLLKSPQLNPCPVFKVNVGLLCPDSPSFLEVFSFRFIR